MPRLRGEAGVVATAILLAATLALGISLIVYAHRVSHTDIRVSGCIPSMLEVDGGLLIYNSCSYDVKLELIPRKAYNITIGNATVTSNSFTLGPGEAAFIYTIPKAVAVDGYLVPVQR